MKKIIISIFLLAAASFGLSAQKDTTITPARERLAEIEKLSVEVKKHKSAKSDHDLFEFNFLAHVGYGRHKVDGDAFRSKFGPSYEIFINAFDLEFNPAGWISFNAGLDMQWDRFISTSRQIEVSGDKYAFAATAPDDINSRICTHGLSIPAMLSLHLGESSLSLGAECIFNLGHFNKAKSSYTAGDSHFTQSTKGGDFEKFRYAYIAAIDFSGLGIYYKYCPKSLIPGSNMIEKYQTIGIVFSM